MFKELNLSDEIVRSIEEKGFTTPTEIQARCIEPLLQGKDIVGRSQTGSGKTFAFGLPAVEMTDASLPEVQVLILSPTRELALQITNEIRKATTYKEGCKLTPVYGGADINKQITALKGAKIVVATPGRLMDHMQRRTVRLSKVKLVVLDEADEMLDMGFRDDIERILNALPKERQTVMFSATMPPSIRALTSLYMKDPEFIELSPLNSTLSEISQSYIKTLPGEKRVVLLNLFKECRPKSAIIFCNTKRTTDEINILLGRHDINCMALHGDMRQNERTRVMTDMKAHRITALVATDVAARGIDIDDVEYVINYDVPQDVEYYIHRIGRTGRAGKSGKAVTFVNNRDELVTVNNYKKYTNSDLTEHPLSKDSPMYTRDRSFLAGMKKSGALNPSAFRRGRGRR